MSNDLHKDAIHDLLRLGIRPTPTLCAQISNGTIEPSGIRHNYLGKRYNSRVRSIEDVLPFNPTCAPSRMISGQLIDFDRPVSSPAAGPQTKKHQAEEPENPSKYQKLDDTYQKPE